MSDGFRVRDACHNLSRMRSNAAWRPPASSITGSPHSAAGVAPPSRNRAWRHPSFRAYADHLDTQEFADGLYELLMLASGLRTALMCAELLWWRCHRRLIADVLTVLDVRVIHLHDDGPGDVHRLAPPARLARGTLTYTRDAPGELTDGGST